MLEMRCSLFPVTVVLESVSLDKFIPESPSSSEPGDVSPCRSPSTPRHLRYRQTGGTNAHRCTTLYRVTVCAHRAAMCCSSTSRFVLFFNVSGSSQAHRGRTLAAQCRPLQRSPSPLLLRVIAALRVGKASREGGIPKVIVAMVCLILSSFLYFLRFQQF